jgi:hypothetical protein
LALARSQKAESTNAVILNLKNWIQGRACPALWRCVLARRKREHLGRPYRTRSALCNKFDNSLGLPQVHSAMRLACLVLLLAAAAPADDGGDPAGTVALQLEAGGSAPLEAGPGANVLCDDPTVVAPDFAADGGEGFVLRALKPGTTLCGLWLVGQKPGGLYRVRVTREADGWNRPDSGAGDAGLLRDGGRDAGAPGAGAVEAGALDGGPG